MTRSAAAGLLLAVALAAAGCGGSGTKAAALRVAKSYGAKHPRVVKIERLRLANGYDKDVALVHGVFCRFTSGGCRATFAEIELTPGTHMQSGATIGISGDDLSAIPQARAASPALGIFPDLPQLVTRCDIPRGDSAGGVVAGTCTSGFAFDGGRGKGGKQVGFVERWPVSRPGNVRIVGGWIVTLGKDGHAAVTAIYGHTPPQLWGTRAASALRHVPTPGMLIRGAVASARRSDSVFRIFPARTGLAACRIPAGGLLTARTFPGVCSTKVIFGGEVPHAFAVRFLERWHAAGRRFRGGWIVTVRRDGRVLGVRTTGDTPPQIWK